MHELGSLLTVAALWALAAISPGPNFLVTAQLSITRSRGAALVAVAGIGVGTAIWGAAGCFGVQALFAAAPWAYLTLKLLGAAWLVCLGARLLWTSWQRAADDVAAIDRVPAKSAAFWLGLATTVANPRSAISVASIFATTMPEHPSTALSALVIATMVAVSVAWYGTVACVLTLRGLAAAWQRGRRWVERVSGACFIFLGIRLASDR